MAAKESTDEMSSNVGLFNAKALIRRSKKFRANQSGNTAIILALLLPIIVGFIGLATDVALWNWEDRKLQSTTDGAAVAAGYAMLQSSDNAALQTRVNTELQSAYPGSSNVTLVSLSRPPTSGNFSGDNTAVEIVVTNKVDRYFSALQLSDDVNLQARAVAQITNTTGFCILGLAQTLDRAVQFKGNADVDLGCGIAVNSNSDESLFVNGTVTVTASPLSTVGKLRAVGSGEIISPTPVKELAPPVEDPYKNLGLPSGPSGCSYNNLKTNGNTTLSPGRYCNGLSLKGNVTLQSGTYIIDGGDLSINAGASVTGDGVTIVLTGSGNDYAEMNVNGGADLDLTAPDASSGSQYAGVLIYQDRNAPTNQGSNVITNKINGGADLKLRGAIYFPSQGIEFTGGANGTIECVQIIAQQVTFSGNAKISNSCNSDDAQEDIVQQYVKLVE